MTFQLAERDHLDKVSHVQDITYHSLWYTGFGALAGTRNSLMGPSIGIDPTTYRTISGRSTVELRVAVDTLESRRKREREKCFI